MSLEDTNWKLLVPTDCSLSEEEKQHLVSSVASKSYVDVKQFAAQIMNSSKASSSPDTATPRKGPYRYLPARDVTLDSTMTFKVPLPAQPTVAPSASTSSMNENERQTEYPEGTKFLIDWVPRLQGKKMTVEGNLLDLSAQTPTTFKQRWLSSKVTSASGNLVYTKKSVYCLEGNMNLSDVDTSMPNFVKYGFMRGFPSNWEMFRDEWRSFRKSQENAENTLGSSTVLTNVTTEFTNSSPQSVPGTSFPRLRSCSSSSSVVSRALPPNSKSFPATTNSSDLLKQEVHVERSTVTPVDTNTKRTRSSTSGAKRTKQTPSRSPSCSQSRKKSPSRKTSSLEAQTLSRARSSSASRQRSASKENQSKKLGSFELTVGNIIPSTSLTGRPSRSCVRRAMEEKLQQEKKKTKKTKVQIENSTKKKVDEVRSPAKRKPVRSCQSKTPKKQKPQASVSQQNKPACSGKKKMTGKPSDSDEPTHIVDHEKFIKTASKPKTVIAYNPNPKSCADFRRNTKILEEKNKNHEDDLFQAQQKSKKQRPMPLELDGVDAIRNELFASDGDSDYSLSSARTPIAAYFDESKSGTPSKSNEVTMTENASEQVNDSYQQHLYISRKLKENKATQRLKLAKPLPQNSPLRGKKNEALGKLLTKHIDAFEELKQNLGDNQMDSDSDEEMEPYFPEEPSTSLSGQNAGLIELYREMQKEEQKSSNLRMALFEKELSGKKKYF